MASVHTDLAPFDALQQPFWKTSYQPSAAWDDHSMASSYWASSMPPATEAISAQYLTSALSGHLNAVSLQPLQPQQPLGLASRRQAGSLYHNKAITKRLASALHYQQVLDVVAEFVQHFDEVNVATALHRLAKLQPASSGSHCSAIVQSPQLLQLTDTISRLLPQFGAQAVSNTMWAFATLAYYPEGDLLDRISEHAVTIIRQFRPQATSNTLWAYAKLSYMPCDIFLVALTDQMVRDLATSVPQDISNALWAFATLRHYPGAELLDAAARQATFSMPRFKPQEIANTLWAYATLSHDPGNQLLDAMAAQMAEKIPQFRPQAVSNSLWAYAKLSYYPGKELLDTAARRACQMLHQYTSQEIANTLWAMASLAHHPGTALLDAAAAQIARRIEQFSPQDVTNSLWSCAKLFHFPHPEPLQASVHYVLRHWHRFRPQEVANIFWAFALLKACPPDTWALLLQKLEAVPIASFDDADHHQLYQAYLLLDSMATSAGCSMGSFFPPALVEHGGHVWRGAVHQTGRLTKLHDEVSSVLTAMGVTHANEHLTADGLFCVDLYLSDDQVVVEVDGPSHFSANTHRPLGRTIGRRSMLEARGYTVRSIPFYEWIALGSIQHQRAYLARLIASAR